MTKREEIIHIATQIMVADMDNYGRYMTSHPKSEAQECAETCMELYAWRASLLIAAIDKHCPREADNG